MKNYYIIPIFVSHRGCPHDCVFCNQKKITGTNKYISGEDVSKTIEEYLSTIDRENSYVELSFFGGSFTGIPLKQQNELLKAGRKAIEQGKIDAIRLSTRPDYIDKDILTNLKKYGVKVIELGVQSLDKEVLKLSERGHTSEDVVEASRLIKEYDFTLGLQMMLGLPGDTKKKDIETAREIIELRPNFVRIYPALVIKDTHMEYLYKSGEYTPLNIDEAVAISKELYYEFTLNNIDIIRIGLQTTEQINLGRDVVAGPFHPAFRELVESSILNDMMVYCIKTYYPASKNIDLYISPSFISRLYADKKRYFKESIKKISTNIIKVKQESSIEGMSLAFNDGKIKRKMSVFEYIKLLQREGFYPNL